MDKTDFELIAMNLIAEAVQFLSVTDHSFSCWSPELMRSEVIRPVYFSICDNDLPYCLSLGNG